jgi:hypothetical protein
MAQLIRGKSKCGLCGQLIHTGDDVVAFPAFLPPSHVLFRFSDTAFHERCFSVCSERSEIEMLYQRWRTLWDSRPHGMQSIDDIEAWGRKTFDEFR